MARISQNVLKPLGPAEDRRGVKPWPIALLILLTVALIIGWSVHAGPMRTAFDGRQQPPSRAQDAPLPAGAPVVEPLVLRELPPDTARRINSQTPFTRAPVPPARPFHITGNPMDQARATDCLAAAIWYEAGAESLAGQKAVAQVVLNRVRHPAFPKSVCGVVFQGAERATGCQFTFTCDGAMARVPSLQGWANARGLARIMLSGEVFKPVGTATHYHTDWVLPFWSAKLDKVHREASHLFFRWSGWWGGLAAFRGRYAGLEPAIAKMAALSPAHAATEPFLLPGDAPLPDANENLAGISTSTVVPSNPYGIKPIVQSSAADFLIFVVPRNADTGMMLSLVLLSCAVKPYCKVLIWTDAKKAPSRLPVTEEHLRSMAFSYLRNRASGIDKALWNCDIFPRSDASQCMKARPALSAPVATPVAANIADR